MAKRRQQEIHEKVSIIDAGAEGKSVARIGDLVVFVPYAAPGDVVDIIITRKKRSYCEGKIVQFHHSSVNRVTPFCRHFGICGGCKWQHLNYENQLFYKEKQVKDHFTRIGRLSIPDILPIIPSANIKHYRNKLEFTFSNRRWFTEADLKHEKLKNTNALGFHLPGIFDRVLDIDECFLQPTPSNEIRIACRDYAIQHQLTFYDARTWSGLLRNLIIRNTTTGHLMVIMVFSAPETDLIFPMLDYIGDKFPQITSLYWVINPKRNDTITDLAPVLYKGTQYMTEEMEWFDDPSGKLRFDIGPLSFFQTNTHQAATLYRLTAEFADLSGNETVYDLYTGTGTIAIYISHRAGKVIGIESIQAAVNDADQNAMLNGIHNISFFCGDTTDMLTDDFARKQGMPDVIILDPPRSGVHAKVITRMVKMLPRKIIYISCNPATQARDIALMDEHYQVEKLQPVDMFPHTHHVENIALLARR